MRGLGDPLKAEFILGTLKMHHARSVYVVLILKPS